MINDDTFARLVAEEVKNKLSPAQRLVLMDSENWGRWQKALLHLIENLENQIESLDADAEADARRYKALGRQGKEVAREAEKAYTQRITKTKRFKFHVEQRLDEVTQMIETGTVVEPNGWDEITFLKRAIATHRELLREYDLEDTAIDRALWDALKNKWSFDDINSNNI